MKIEGIENVRNREHAKTLFELILKLYDAEDEIVVDEAEGTNIYTINEDKYALYYPEEEDSILYNHNKDRFEELVSEVPKAWRDYIDGDKWIEENGVTDFEEYLSDEFYDNNIEYLESVHYFDIYKIS